MADRSVCAVHLQYEFGLRLDLSGLLRQLQVIQFDANNCNEQIQVDHVDREGVGDVEPFLQEGQLAEVRIFTENCHVLIKEIVDNVAEFIPLSGCFFAIHKLEHAEGSGEAEENENKPFKVPDDKDKELTHSSCILKHSQSLQNFPRCSENHENHTH